MKTLDDTPSAEIEKELSHQNMKTCFDKGYSVDQHYSLDRGFGYVSVKNKRIHTLVKSSINRRQNQQSMASTAQRFGATTSAKMNFRDRDYKSLPTDQYGDDNLDEVVSTSNIFKQITSGKKTQALTYRHQPGSPKFRVTKSFRKTASDKFLGIERNNLFSGKYNKGIQGKSIMEQFDDTILSPSGSQNFKSELNNFKYPECDNFHTENH